MTYHAWIRLGSVERWPFGCNCCWCKSPHVVSWLFFRITLSACWWDRWYPNCGIDLTSRCLAKIIAPKNWRTSISMRKNHKLQPVHGWCYLLSPWDSARHLLWRCTVWPESTPFSRQTITCHGHLRWRTPWAAVIFLKNILNCPALKITEVYSSTYWINHPLFGICLNCEWDTVFWGIHNKMDGNCHTRILG